MKTAVILGIGSDIGCEIAARLRADDWQVTGFRHIDAAWVAEPWDLIVCCYGTLNPIGSFWEADPEDWERSWQANLFQPLRQVRELYPHRNRGASVCFFSGAGSGGPAPTYSAYAGAKVALIKMTELLDSESPDCKFFILGPGMVQTKIHEQTMRAGARAANFDRVREFGTSVNGGTSHDNIYACLMACVAVPKEGVGGRNICVHLDDWPMLHEDPDMFKLRRLTPHRIRGNQVE